ncbi:4-(cytidine 5'-diphospho)-2-C-methyl-D-erythritol kinase [Marinilongibacter aquaticus]|nr:4-(cytidine 5'-diphospho)-2-C-methyl-D-erythritol kinase [Marinilongibacter aquaticus]
MLTFPNAKINIGLNITEKRPDGFHNIESVFYPIPLCDALEALPSHTLTFSQSGMEIAGNKESNLVFRAFELIRPRIKDQMLAKVHLHKVIPMGAGLGGGSADGAFALKLFNSIFQLNLSQKEMEEMAAELGSDCPFFIANKPVFCYDRGIKFKPIELELEGWYIVLVNPNIHISTAEAYAAITPKIAPHNLLESIKRPVEEWKGLIQNDFEEALREKYPILGKIKETLYTKGATYSAMTGSGSTVYGLFREKIAAESLFPDFSTWQFPLPQ